MRFLRWVSVFILKVSCLLRSWSLTRVFLVKPSNLRSQVLYQVLESCVMSIAAERGLVNSWSFFMNRSW